MHTKAKQQAGQAKKPEASKKKLLYVAMLFSISFILLIAATLGWFVHNKNNEVGVFAFGPSNSHVNFYYSEDDTTYYPESPDHFTFQYLFPMKPLYFRVDIIPFASGHKVSGELLSISKTLHMDGTPLDDDGDPDNNDIDLADVLMIEYWDPNDPTATNPVSKSMAEFFAEVDAVPDTRDIVLFENFVHTYAPEANPLYRFHYKIYMKATAGDEYQNLKISITHAKFTVTDET